MSEVLTKSKVRSRVRRFWLVTGSGFAALLLIGLVAPLVNAAHFSSPIRQALESALGRKVEFDRVHFSLFSGPGFSMEGVTIAEDPHYGAEPFAYVTTLEARLRIDKLLLGQIRFSSLRLVDPFLNLVKRSDGTWNVVELIRRLSVPARGPLNFLPAFEVSDGRIDFKFGTRKSTLYLLNSDLTIYPERSGKLYIRFSGSPARTDRAQNGFGYLRGNVNWYLNPSGPSANQLEADVNLEPSNLSELTTLFEGHDLGVHGTVSSRAHIEGPAGALHVTGELRLADVHRWDLLPSSGEDWRIKYQGSVDLLAHSLNVETVPRHAADANAVELQVRIGDFLNRPSWSVLATLNNAPVQDLLPLSKRMGLSVPEDLDVSGAIQGVIGYSNTSGLAGSFAITDAKATLPGIPPLRTALVNTTVSGDRIHFEPALIETSRGTLQAGGDYYLSSSGVHASLIARDFSVDALKNTIQAWFGAPEALRPINDGEITGQFFYSHPGVEPGIWSGQFQFANATLKIPPLAAPLRKSQGRIAFDDTTFEVTHFSAMLGEQEVRANYRYTTLAKRPERIHVELPSADLNDIETMLEPVLQPQGFLARLRLARRAVPAWLSARNLEGDAFIGQFSINHTSLGPLSSHFIWQGTNVNFSRVQLNLPEGLIRARGTVNISSYLPQYLFAAKITGFAWRSGLLSADGELESSGIGIDSLQNMRASGTFLGEGVALSADDVFSKLSGAFEFSFADGWPNLRLSRVRASDGEDSWEGEAESQSDGKLIFDLEHDGRQRRVISSLLPANSPTVSFLSDTHAPQTKR